MLFSGILNCPLGEILIQDNAKEILSVEFLDSTNFEIPPPSALTKEAIKQLQEYFLKKRKSFNLPLKMQGSPFQKSVWESLLKIPYGSTKSYKDIAISINNKNASRAVGSANNKNKIAIFIPCHRAISANGKINGYAAGVDKKRFLLELEGIFLKH
ncbi:MAG: methylated-DNA--[protein]-cysteine S-methyltransferase [Helicobacter sp.]|nr:methylated-DNA--[protein]-cysteine S-methyltransferase [Helicobacteraceae bacterium]MDY3113674.1 methylated-DNA--[protein]-cysteine S-methyltransferase [Helicobacter sp.]